MRQMMLSSKFFLFLCSCLCISLLHCTDEPSTKISEGWVLHGTLKFSILSREIDCSSLHSEMANRVNNAFIAQNTGGIGDEEGSKCTAVIRFQFIYEDGTDKVYVLSCEGLATPDEAEEITFVSGKMPSPQPKGGYGSLELTSPIRGNIGSVFFQYLFPKQSLGRGIITCKRDALIPEVVKDDIIRRWYPGRRTFFLESLRPIYALHQSTLELISSLSTLPDKKRRLEGIKAEAAPSIAGKSEIVDILLATDVEQLVAAEAKMAAHRKRQDTCDACMKKIDSLEKTGIDFLFKNPEVNNYTCAEQTAIAFMEDQRFASTLEKVRSSGKKLQAVIMHVCSYLSPCHHCAASWVRETEGGGILNNAFKGLPIQVITSCILPYDRTGKRVQYEQVNFKPADERAFMSPYVIGSMFPYPLVLLLEREPNTFKPKESLPNILSQFASQPARISGSKKK